ncbi:MAG: hypothetical protein ACXVSX_09050 [Solirubrobacteraceae bacterium]
MPRPVTDLATPGAAAHPVLAATLAAWDGAGVRWCLLRGSAELSNPVGDVDLLVDARDLDVVRGLLTGRGAFMEKTAWGRRPHRFFLTYVEDEDRWLKLDVVTELCFGLRHELRTHAASAVLGRSVRDGAVVHPAPPDAFWTLLLHALLDRRSPNVARAGDVPRHAPDARAGDSPLAALVDAACPSGWDAMRIVDAAATGRFDELRDIAPALRAGWPGAGLGAGAMRRTVRGALRRADRRRPLQRGVALAVIGGSPHERAELANALAGAWPERAATLDGHRRIAVAARRARGGRVVRDVPEGGAAAARADVRVRLVPGRDADELRRMAQRAAWRRRLGQGSERMASKSSARSTG